MGRHRPAWPLVVATSLTLAGPAAAQDRDQVYDVFHRNAARSQPTAGRLAGFPLFSTRSAPAPAAVEPNPAPAARPADPQARPARPAQPRPPAPQAYCVRLCDGFFFPASPVSGAPDPRRAQEQACAALCPGAEVALYTAGPQGGIETARGPRGRSYASLRTAFRFRERLDAACTCSGLAGGLARLPITEDRTLRRGDMVVGQDSVRIFAGAPRFPYRPRDFVEARAYSRLPADVRRRVAEIEAGIEGRELAASPPVIRIGARSARRAGMPPQGEVSSLPLGAGTTTDGGVRVLDMSRRPAAEGRR